MTKKQSKEITPEIVFSRYYVQSHGKIVKSSGVYGMEGFIENPEIPIKWYRYDVRYVVDICLTIKEDGNNKFPSLDITTYPFSSDKETDISNIIAERSNYICKTLTEKSLVGIKTLYDVRENKIVVCDDFDRSTPMTYLRFKESGIIFCTKDFPYYATTGDSIIFVESSTKYVAEFLCVSAMCGLSNLLEKQKDTATVSTFGSTFLSLVFGYFYDQSDDIINGIVKEAENNKTGPSDYLLYRIRNFDLSLNVKNVLDFSHKKSDIGSVLSKSNKKISHKEISSLDQQAIEDLLSFSNGEILLSTLLDIGASKVAKISLKQRIAVNIDIPMDGVKRAWFNNGGLFIEPQTLLMGEQATAYTENLKFDFDFDDVYLIMS